MRKLIVVFMLTLYSVTGSTAAAGPIESALEQWITTLLAADRAAVQGQPLAAPALLAEVYAKRDYRPAWTERSQTAALLQAVEESVLDGLRPEDFHVRSVRRYHAGPSVSALSSDALAARDILLTDALARLLHQLYHGKVDPQHLDPHWNLERREPAGDVQALVSDAFAGDGVAAAVERARLDHPTYRLLRQALARYRAIAVAGGWRPLPPGPLLRPGMTDPALAVLRERLLLTGDLDQPPPDDPDLYGPAMERAVRRFQARHGLEVDAVIGPATRAALNLPVERRIDQLRANLERARWTLRLPQADVLDVDIAGFSVERLEHGRTVWRSRAIVGQPFRQTPVFADDIEYIVFNPTWTVPRRILVQDILPRLRRDPSYLAAQGFDVVDAFGQPVPLATAAAAALAGADFPWTLVQRPGPLNALGRVKFMFPNRFAVYLHDTPARALFARADRSFSSGCIRVQDAVGLAEILLEHNAGWDRARIEAAIASGETRTVFLQRRLPVRLLYRTAHALPDGRVVFRADIYGRDGPLLAALARPFGPGMLPSEPPPDHAAANAG